MRYKPMQRLHEPPASIVIPRLLIALAAAVATMLTAPSLTGEFVSLVRAPAESPVAWSIFASVTAAWLAYGYGWARASGAIALWRHLVTLFAAPAIVAVAIGTHILLGLVLSAAWVVWAAWTGWTLARTDPLAGVMALPLIGASASAALLLLTLSLLP